MAHSLDWFKYYTSTLTGIGFKRMKKAKIDGFADLRDKLEAAWVEFLTMAAIANNGQYVSPNIDSPYTEQDIADYLEREPNEIDVCLKWFKSQGMMDEDAHGWFIVNWDIYQKQLSADDIKEQNRIRQQRYRDNHKQIESDSNASNVTHNVTSHRLDKEVDVDVDKDKKKIKTLKNKTDGSIDTSCSDSKGASDDDELF